MAAATAASSMCCSIEMEPRTLSEGQLNQARETAEGIAKKFQPKEAEFIFTEGMKPIHSVQETKFDERMNENYKQRERRIEIHPNAMSTINQKGRIAEKPCQCTLPDPLQEPSSSSLDQAMTSPPHTAPF